MGLVYAVFSRESEMSVCSKGWGVVVYGAAGCVVALLLKAFLKDFSLSCSLMAQKLCIELSKVRKSLDSLYLAIQHLWSKICCCAPGCNMITFQK